MEDLTLDLKPGFVQDKETNIPKLIVDLLDEHFGPEWYNTSEEKNHLNVTEQFFMNDFSFSYISEEFLINLSKKIKSFFSEFDFSENHIVFRIYSSQNFEEISNKKGIKRDLFVIDYSFMYKDSRDFYLFSGWITAAQVYTKKEMLSLVIEILSKMNMKAEISYQCEELQKIEEENNSKLVDI